VFKKEEGYGEESKGIVGTLSCTLIVSIITVNIYFRKGCEGGLQGTGKGIDDSWRSRARNRKPNQKENRRVHPIRVDCFCSGQETGMAKISPQIVRKMPEVVTPKGNGDSPPRDRPVEGTAGLSVRETTDCWRRDEKKVLSPGWPETH